MVGTLDSPTQQTLNMVNTFRAQVTELTGVAPTHSDVRVQ